MLTTTAVKPAKPHLEILQKYTDDYLAETKQETVTTKELAVWAIRTGRWEPPPDLLLKKCQEEFSRALREQYIKDDCGRPVRAKHVARITKGAVQQYLWADIRHAKRSHMETAFQQRRRQISGDVRQLHRDKSYYNDAHPEQEPIQLSLDFNDDIEEGNFSSKYPPKKPR